MKNEEKKVIYWAIISMGIFLLVNWLLTLPVMQLNQRVVLSEAWQVTFIALAFYAATILLAVLKVRISYYLMAVVVAIYTVGLVGMLTTMFTGSSANILIRLAVAALSAFGIIVNLYWYGLAFKLRSVLQTAMIKKRMKNKQLKK
ncbi:hypothetical protein FEZ41_14270 [Lentilactobacillus parafarraginis]|uniref:Integral membrane protein n=2 Tax=Lentilactobacillus parafarraginis TaxID=390842 RepID=A0A0R1YBU8_9LACO|nr:hypothetical protein [Lentilactobacillus parafarraginis]KRM36476.1 hypothetical protein FD47_GL000700 [Lentilactobacillus parafarraginis DSM 18390 = JCM 14109]TLQ14193.1 hypothetical protein FEZ41_14270 [Lentilactobacillus parafarraginis]